MDEDEKNEPWRRVTSVKPRLQNKNIINSGEVKHESHETEYVRCKYTINSHKVGVLFFSFC